MQFIPNLWQKPLNDSSGVKKMKNNPQQVQQAQHVR
jgi:hypothetical protein